MKRLGLVVAVMLALASIGFGQTKAERDKLARVVTIEQQKEFIANADWMLIGEPSNEPMYIDTNSVARAKSLVIFRFKLVGEMSGVNYGTILAGCTDANFVYMYMFGELPDKSIYRLDAEPISNVYLAEKGTRIYVALVYTCNYKGAKIVPIPDK